MSPKKGLDTKKSAARDTDEYNFDIAVTVSDVELLAGKLKSSGKGKDALAKSFKQLAKALEAAPQDVAALGSAKDSLPLQLLEHVTAGNADKELRLYGALCIVYIMRIYAPDVPYSDEQLKEIFELLLGCWAQLADTGATGTFEICRATLQTFADVKFYILMLDLEDPDLLARTFATLLQAARPENLQVLEAPLMEVLSGILEEIDQPSQELCDTVLASMAGAAVLAGAGDSNGKGGASASQYTVASQRLVARLLTSRDSVLRGAVQREVLSYVRKSLQDAAAGAPAGGGGGRAGKKSVAAASNAIPEGAPCDTFTLLNALHAAAPLLLLPVVPELKAQLRHEDENHRAAAAELVTRLMAASPPAQGAVQQTSSMATGTLGLVTAAVGSGATVPLAVQFPDLLQELLSRFADQSPALRQQMLLRTGQLAAVAASTSPDGAVERQLLNAARDRLHDFDERVRAAACRGLCSLAAAAASGQPPPGTSPGAGTAMLYDDDMDAVLQDVKSRLRDLKVVVRKDAASGLLVAWRAACTALQQGALSLPGLVRSVGWIPARLCTEAHRDLELRPHLMALLAAPPTPQQLLHHTHVSATGGRSGPGVLPASLGKQLGAAVWTALWASYGETERTVVRKVLALKAKAACEVQQLVKLRRQLRAAAAAVESSQPSDLELAQRTQQRVQLRLMELCRSLARDVGGSTGSVSRAAEQLWALVGAAKDNFFWDRLMELTAPGTSPEALAAARKDAMSRLPSGGSKSPTADLINRISHLAQPTLLSELVCTTAVRVLRHGVRHCPATTGPGRGGGSPAAKGDADRQRDQKKKARGAAEEEEEEEQEEEDGNEKASPKHSKKRARTATAQGAVAVNGATRRTTRGQQQEKQQREQEKRGKDQRDAADDIKGNADGDDESRAALVDALTALSQGPYSKAAKAAVHALWAVLDPGEGKRVVGQLAKQLMGQLRPGREALAATPVVLQAMASVGEVAPDIFSEHVDAFCKFVIQHYMLASLKPLSESARTGHGRNTAPAAVAPIPDTDTGWKPSSFGVACKIAALRALARGCTPQTDASAATTAAVSSDVVDLLIQLLSIDNDLAEYGAANEADGAHLRMAAARALLRLSKRHDSKLSAPSYVALALTMQDPIVEVRQLFGEQVRHFLLSSVQLQQRSSVISKYTALLPLAAMDPRPENQDAAARALREVVRLQRVRAQDAALEAVKAARGAAAGSSGSTAATPRSSLSDLPEFMLAFLLYILAHHPDCPMAPDPSQQGASGSEAQDQEEAPAPEDYRPFQDMLQFALEPLLGAMPAPQAAGAAGPAAATFGGVGEALPTVCKVLRSVKLQMGDADETFEPSATRTIRVLADIGIAVAKAIVKRELIAAGASREGRQNRGGGGGGGSRGTPRDKQQQVQDLEATATTTVAELARRDHPARAVVPMLLYKLVDSAETRGIRADGSCLPPNYQVVLSPAVAEMGRRATTMQPQASDKTAARATGRKKPGSLPATGGRGGSGDVAAGSEGDEAAAEACEGNADSEGEEDRSDEKVKQPAVKSGGRGGAAKRKAEVAAEGGGGTEGATKKGPRGRSMPGDARRGRSAGRGRGKAAASPRTAGARATKRRSRGGYESLSEGEPSSSSEEEEEGEEEEEEEDVGESQKTAPKVGKAGDSGNGEDTAAAGAAASVKAPFPGAAGPRDQYKLPEDELRVNPKRKGGQRRPAQAVHASGSGGNDGVKTPIQQQGKRAERQDLVQRLPPQQRQQRNANVASEPKDDGKEEQGPRDDADGGNDKENEAVKPRGGGGVAKPGGGALKSPPNKKRTRGPADGQGSGTPGAAAGQRSAAAGCGPNKRPARGAAGQPRQASKAPGSHCDGIDADEQMMS
ncbi:hypothetical protein Vafri_1442 [Volvox africanus]|nr:hypothetical protein Vafri_1442 [Volvox africanus]